MEDKKVLVEFKNVNKQYPTMDHKVLNDFSFEFLSGETHVICGRSGAGKSTLIRCINGLETIDDGTLLFEGEAVTKKSLKDIRKKCAMVFQDFNLFPHMTALENVTFGPIHSLGISKAESEETGRMYLERVGLGDKFNSYPGQLSGGQKQRVAIARALNMHPDLILFDEPTSALDPEMIGEVLDIMKKLAKDGMSMIVVTHEMGFAREAADRISFLENGKFIETDPPEVFFNNPSDPSVERFIKQISYE